MTEDIYLTAQLRRCGRWISIVPASQELDLNYASASRDMGLRNWDYVGGILDHATYTMQETELNCTNAMGARAQLWY